MYSMRAGDFPQVQVAHESRNVAVIAFETIEEVAGLIEDDQLAAEIEDFVDAGMLGQVGRVR